MGFSKKEIYRIITKENTIMTVLGILIGMPIGRIMIRSVEEVFSNELYTLHTPISLKSYIWASALTIIFVALAQLSTLRKINKLDFMEALKSRIS
jgi:putative ABC transport system permease protein